MMVIIVIICWFKIHSIVSEYNDDGDDDDWPVNCLEALASPDFKCSVKQSLSNLPLFSNIQ